MAAAKKSAGKKGGSILAGTTKVRELATIWKPTREEAGARCAGRLVSCEEKILDPKKGKPAKVLTLAPCITVDKNGVAAAERSVSLVLSSSLGLRIQPETDTGVVFEIAFLGFEHSEKGNNDWRNYEVNEGTVEGLRTALRDLGAADLADVLPSEV